MATESTNASVKITPTATAAPMANTGTEAREIIHSHMHEVPQINPYNALVTDAVTICEINFFMEFSVLALAYILGK